MTSKLIFNHILEPFGKSLNTEAAQAFADFKIDPSVLRQLEILATKSTEGRLTESERADYETHVSAVDFLAMLQAVARARLKRNESNS